MTTTSHLQIYPDFFNTKEECESFKFKPKIQTNSRYKNFNQTHFTAGDEQQFEEYKFSKNNSNTSLNGGAIYDKDLWEKYFDLNASSVYNTFRFLFYKFKKGLFVKIVDNKLKVFLPFSNSNFQNEWSNCINLKNSKEIFEYVCKIDGRTFNEKNVNLNISSWYANNFLLRYEYPIKEGDTNICVFKNMLEELCSKREIPDIEFFINRRDFPLHTTSLSEPYFDIWNAQDLPLKSHNYEKYCPILSMCKTDSFEDILIPTHEDWSRIKSHENVWFPNSLRSTENTVIDVDWGSKKPIAVFRGSSTGKGVTIESNPRLKIAYLSSQKVVDKKDQLPYLDAGITKWNVRPRKITGCDKLQTIDVESLPFDLVPYLSFEEQSKYKYIVHIDGHVSAFRLSMELGIGSVILMVETEWKTWYVDKLKPMVHYVPVKKDLSDLIEKIKWCKKNDKKCQKMAQNCLKFYKEELQKDSVLDYLQKTLHKLKKHMGEYYYIDVSYNEIKNKEELSEIRKLHERNLDRIDMLRGFEIYKSKSTFIEKVKFGDIDMCRKTGKKEKENIHEVFVGIVCVNKILRSIPNFCFTVGLTSKNTVITRYASNTCSLFSYIQSVEFDFQTYVFSILQLCLALQVAQNTFNFVHYDSSPWNILLQKLDQEVDVEYKINLDETFTVRTKVVPILIDYGKSYFIHRNQHHGFIKMFKFSSVQDIFTILITSIYEIVVHQHLNTRDFRYLIKLCNFLTGGDFRKENFKNSKEIKSFLSHQKKYSNLIDGNKHELEDKTPMDLFHYITRNFSIYEFPYKKSMKSVDLVLYPSNRRHKSCRMPLRLHYISNEEVIMKNIVFHELDFFSVQKVQEMLSQIKERSAKKKYKNYKCKILQRYNLANKHDFKNILKKLIENNPILQEKLTKL